MAVIQLEHPIYGLMAEFETPEELVDATRRAYQAGYRKMDAYTPFPVEGLSEALGMRHTWLSAVILLGGVIGAVGGYAMQYYAMVISYPLNIGGRPYHSWPAFIPITFELSILTAALFAILGMFALNELPEPYHPVFNVPNFEQASRHRFFLSVESKDPYFDRDKTRRFLEGLKPIEISEIDY